MTPLVLTHAADMLRRAAMAPKVAQNQGVES
jgi:hypothetical protein